MLYFFTWEMLYYLHGTLLNIVMTFRYYLHWTLLFTWDIIIYMARLRKSLVTCPSMFTKMSPFYIDRTHSIYREHIRYISINVHQNVMMPIGYYLFTWDIFIYMGRHRKSLVTRRPKCHDAHSLFFT